MEMENLHVYQIHGNVMDHRIVLMVLMKIIVQRMLLVPVINFYVTMDNVFTKDGSVMERKTVMMEVMKITVKMTVILEHILNVKVMVVVYH